jgi:hypothetical protein
MFQKGRPWEQHTRSMIWASCVIKMIEMRGSQFHSVWERGGMLGLKRMGDLLSGARGGGRCMPPPRVCPSNSTACSETSPRQQSDEVGDEEEPDLSDLLHAG